MKQRSISDSNIYNAALRENLSARRTVASLKYLAHHWHYKPGCAIGLALYLP